MRDWNYRIIIYIFYNASYLLISSGSGILVLSGGYKCINFSTKEYDNGLPILYSLPDFPMPMIYIFT